MYRFVPHVFVLFFVLLVVFDALFIYVAHKSYSGIPVVIEAEKESCTECLKGAFVQDQDMAFKWSFSVARVWNKRAKAVLKLYVKNDHSQLSGITKVVLKIMSPVTAKYDQAVLMKKKSVDCYEADIECSDGQWDVVISILASEKQYVITDRVLVYRE